MKIVQLKKAIISGKIFIYPTDTIYGLGCNALNKKVVEKIKQIKKREREKPLSVIAPSIKWIEENCIVDCNLKKYFPGAYTIIFAKKNKNFLPWVSGESIGVRIPKHEFTEKIQEAGVPFITTSVNLSGEKPANKIIDIGKEILNKADFVIDGGELSGKPSVLIIKGKEMIR